MVDIMHVISKVFCSSESIQARGRKLSLESSGMRGGVRARVTACLKRPGLQSEFYFHPEFYSLCRRRKKPRLSPSANQRPNSCSGLPLTT